MVPRSVYGRVCCDDRMSVRLRTEVPEFGNGLVRPKNYWQEDKNHII